MMLAREKCLEEGILTEFLENEEVIEMWALDRDYETEIEIIREQELDAAEERGEARGILSGQNLMGRLCTLLVKDKRLDDIVLVTNDEEYRYKLLEEYGLK